MRLIFAALLLAFVVFFNSIELSSQSKRIPSEQQQSSSDDDSSSPPRSNRRRLSLAHSGPSRRRPKQAEPSRRSQQVGPSRRPEQPNPSNIPEQLRPPAHSERPQSPGAGEPIVPRGQAPPNEFPPSRESHNRLRNQPRPITPPRPGRPPGSPSASASDSYSPTSEDYKNEGSDSSGYNARYGVGR